MEATMIQDGVVTQYYLAAQFSTKLYCLRIARMIHEIASYFAYFQPM